MRVRIFVDFWNFQLTVYEHASRKYRLDWKKLSPLLVNEASVLIGQPLAFEETRVYMSYDPHRDSDRSLHSWATNTLDRFSGVAVTIRERKPRNPPFCNNCHKPIVDCPHCGDQIARTVEKGVDTAIVTDLMSLAWEGVWDVAVLLSSDRDFIPAVELLAVKGYRIINAHFPPVGMDLARKCWARIDMIKHLKELERADNPLGAL